MITPDKQQQQQQRRRKRDKTALSFSVSRALPLTNQTRTRRISKALEKHGHESPSGGVSSLLPSLVGVAILICGVMAKMGFRGRASVAGIDLGTTNSVVCVQALAKGVGQIDCIPDPSSSSVIIPSVVSFLEPWERKVGPSSKIPSLLQPHPSHVVVGQAAKRRIDSHPHHTLYNAKRVLGRSFADPAVAELAKEVEFQIVPQVVVTQQDEGNNEKNQISQVAFSVPDSPHHPIRPQQVGAYVVHHLMQLTKQYLGHDNVKSAVICVPAKFNNEQKRATYQAFQMAGIKVARVLEEPTAAALAYGLHRKEGVDYILVYDFGGGTLDVSLLRVSEGFVDVMGSDGDDRLGGADFDAAVAHFLLHSSVDTTATTDISTNTNTNTTTNGQGVVEQTAQQLQQLATTLEEGMDLEDKLASNCPALATTPLCTLSSFHSLGEQMKIGLSNMYYNYHEQKTNQQQEQRKTERRVDNDESSNFVVDAQCLAPPAVVSPEQPSSTSRTITDFCASLAPITLRIHSHQYDQAVQPLLDRSLLPIQRLLQDLDLKVSDIDEVVLVGGTTRMPQIRELVQRALHSSQVNTHIDPDITVAYGAASVID